MATQEQAATIIASALGALWSEPPTSDAGTFGSLGGKATPVKTTTTTTDHVHSPPGTFGQPVEFDPNAIESGQRFGAPRSGHRHAGVDLGVPEGTTVHAAISGTVTVAQDDGDNGYGRWIEVSDNARSTRYGHLSTLNVKVGDKVQADMPIGVSGNTGDSSGPHPHFEYREGGTAIDPLPFLAMSGSILSEGSPIEPAAATTTTTTTEEYTTEAKVGQGVEDVLAALRGETPEGQPEGRTTTETTPGKPGTPGTTGSATGEWAQDILTGIGAPVTPENLRFMDAWMRAEGGANHNNPLNTTWDQPGATNWNDVGVKIYPDYASGLSATLKTLNNGMYGGILLALRRGDNAMNVAKALQSSPWGTGDLVTRILGG